MQPWEPELHVTLEMARKLIEDQFPDLIPIRIEGFGVGWDNIVYQVNEKWLFRFPQRQIAVDGVVREINCLPILNQELGCVPKIEFVGRKTQDYPWPFFGYLPVNGFELTQSQKVQVQWSGLAKELGSILSKLHSGQIFQRLCHQLPEDPLGRLDFTKRVPMTEKRLVDLESLQVDLPYADLRKTLNLALTTPKLPCRSVVHGDFHFRHLVIETEGTLGGLIDWGDIHLNDPAVDLEAYWAFLGPQERKIFAKSYGPISEVQLIQARSFAVFTNVALLISSISQQQAEISKKAQQVLNLILLD